MRTLICFRILVVVILLLVPLVGAAQTTEFTYQGKLVDGGMPASASYDFEFRLFATDSGGAAIATQPRLAVPVANGVFTVTLDFGGQFDGNPRWLEIAVKPAGSPNPLSVLTPRQPITSTPHAIRSLSSARADVATNSLQLGGVNASQYVLTTDSRMTNARNPLPNSASYIQNSIGLQNSSNFSISGNGTAGGTLSGNAVSATTEYRINGNRVLSMPASNVFVGSDTGTNNTTGAGNSFIGSGAGANNTSGSLNSFFGNSAGGANTTGDHNAFFGLQAGLVNTASFNSFFGSRAGLENTNGNENSFFGAGAGGATTSGDDNSFFGRNAGSGNTTGNSNTFFGFQAGKANTTGSNNTAIGNGADVNTGNLSFATAIGAGAVVNTSSTITLGRSSGLDLVRVPGFIILTQLDSAGSTDVCRNALNFLSTCSSSLRYKTSVQPFSGGLNLVKRLRPITFNWKDGGRRDVGFGAEEVEKVEPLLVTYNEKGEIEGVKYGQLTTVLVNAVKEQQTQIETLKSQADEQKQVNQSQQRQVDEQKEIVKRQQVEIEALKKLICLSQPQAGICKEK